MPSEQNKWEIKQLKEKAEDEKQLRVAMEKEIKEIQSFRTKTIEQLKTLFNEVKSMKKSNQWVSKTAFTLIFGGIVTAVGAFIKWMFTG